MKRDTELRIYIIILFTLVLGAYGVIVELHMNGGAASLDRVAVAPGSGNYEVSPAPRPLFPILTFPRPQTFTFNVIDTNYISHANMWMSAAPLDRFIYAFIISGTDTLPFWFSDTFGQSREVWLRRFTYAEGTDPTLPPYPFEVLVTWKEK